MATPTPDFARALEFASLRSNAITALRWVAPSVARKKFAARLARFVNKRLYPIGIGAVLNRYDSSFSLYSSRADHRLYQGFDRDAIFANFGSGAFQHPRWRNFDYPGQSDYYKAIQGTPGVDFTPIDLCAPELTLPFETDAVSLIYCSHTLEHLEEQRALRFLGECARVLAPGGVLRLALPDTRRDFTHARVIAQQAALPEAERMRAMRSAAVHLLASVADLPDARIAQMITQSGFDTDRFYPDAKQDPTISTTFSGDNPERHISYWSHDNLLAQTAPCGFDAYLPLFRGASTQAPFRSLEVFDNTEPHIAFYGEFIGKQWA